MFYKKDYFIRAAAELGYNTIAEYLKSANVNYIIVPRDGKDVPEIWVSDKTPVIYGSVDDVEIELEYNVQNPEKMTYITEYKFIVQYCGAELQKLIADKIISLGEHDGVTYIHHPKKDITFTYNNEKCFLNMIAVCDTGINLLISNGDNINNEFISIDSFTGENECVIADILEELGI